MAQTVWMNDRCNELLDEIKQLNPDYTSKTGVVENALEQYRDSFEAED